jgi:VanZ family protein
MLNKARLAWLPVFAWMGLISYLSTDSFAGPWSEGLLGFWVTLLHLPVGAHGLQLANLVLRKAAHMFEYLVLGTLLYRALSPERHAGEPIEWRVLVRVLLLGFAFAVLDELHQAFTRTRGPSFVDVAWDFAGVLGSQLAILVGPLARRPPARPPAGLS